LSIKTKGSFEKDSNKAVISRDIIHLLSDLLMVHASMLVQGWYMNS